MQMVLLESLNAQLFREIRFCINFLSQIRPEPFGTIHIIVSLELALTQLGIKTTFCVETEYCDGLRGAFVVYDADDPYKNLYVGLLNPTEGFH